MTVDHLLSNDQYSIAYELHHEELIPFVQQNLKKLNIITITYFSLNVIIILWIGFEMFLNSNGKSIAILSEIFLGFAPTLILVPFHEYIHGVSYRIIGAPSVHYTANWKKFYFTAQADKFVVGVKAFYIIAFAPITVINICVLITMIFVGPTAYYILLGVLFIHTAMCSGDFAIASYMHGGRKNEMVTYDDVANRKTYFFIKSPFPRQH